MARTCGAWADKENILLGDFASRYGHLSVIPRWLTSALACAVALAVLVPPACGAQRARDTTHHTRGTKVLVSNWPPDSIPLAIWKQMHSPENMEASAPEWGVPFPRNIVVVMFQEETSRTYKQRAIDAIRGTVVGGVALCRGGYYYVRIPDDGTSRPLFRAIKKLKTFRQVQSATPELPQISPL